MALKLYSNRNLHSDFIQRVLTELSSKADNVYIAVAFLTNTTVLESLSKKGCTVQIVVRLGFPTSPNPDKLEKGLGSWGKG